MAAGVTSTADGIAGTFWIFSQSELDAGNGAFKDQVLRAFSPAHFEHQSLAADGIGGAMQDVGAGDAAGQGSINGDVFGVDDVLDVHHGGDGHAAFIDVSIDADVGVAVDDAGHDELACGVDDGGALGDHDLLGDLGDFAVAHQDGAFEGAVSDGHHGGVFNYDDFGVEG